MNNFGPIPGGVKGVIGDLVDVEDEYVPLRGGGLRHRLLLLVRSHSPRHRGSLLREENLGKIFIIIYVQYIFFFLLLPAEA